MKLKLSIVSSFAFLLFISSAYAASTVSSPAAAEPASIARIWNEAMLAAVRLDYARPTVTARNLYHLSVAMHDAWAMYDETKPMIYINFRYALNQPADLEKARRESISYAAHSIIKARYSNGPNAAKVLAALDQRMKNLGYDPEFSETYEQSYRGTGLLIAQMIRNQFAYDGSGEDEGYVTPLNRYVTLNPPLIVKHPGFGFLFDVNFWQPLALDEVIDQGGNPIPAKVVPPLTLHWGSLPPFALTANEKTTGKIGVYLDPGTPPKFGGQGHQEFVDSMAQVVEYSSWLDPRDGVTMDISPGAIGNNPFASYSGHGHKLNPVTGKPYPAQFVKRADFARVLAEFWADGPSSETPPGHWNVMANDACKHPSFKRQWMGQGPELPSLEWDAKLYVALNGALYDASIAAWGIKGYYQGSRPLSAIRFLSSAQARGRGFQERPEVIELLTFENTKPGAKHARFVGHEGEYAVRSWKGAPKNPDSEFLGVDWILGAAWVPYQRPTFVTPPFPGYVSGHSTFSRAAAEVMAAVTGSEFFPGGIAEYVAKKNEYLVFEDGPSETIKLQWATYADAADQSALSRIFGGIHGSIDDLPGRAIGRTIGRKSVARANQLFNAKPAAAASTPTR